MKNLTLSFRGMASTPDWLITSEVLGEVCTFVPTSTNTQAIIGDYANLFFHSDTLLKALQNVSDLLRKTEDMPETPLSRLDWYANKLNSVTGLAKGFAEPIVRQIVRTRDDNGDLMDSHDLFEIELNFNAMASKPVWEISNCEQGLICTFVPTTNKTADDIYRLAHRFSASLGFRDFLREIAIMAGDTEGMPASPTSRLDWYAKRLSQLAHTTRIGLMLAQPLAQEDEVEDWYLQDSPVAGQTAAMHH